MSAITPVEERARIDETARVQEGASVQAATMKAVVQDRYGSADVLRLAEIPRPAIADDEVLVRVRAAAIHRGDWHLMTGLPYLVRVMGYGLRRPKTRVRGNELAGIVESVGAKVTELAPGNEVFGWGDGAFAERAAVKQANLLRKPANLTFEQAAAVVTSAITALQAVRDKGRVGPGQEVLVTGATGGVGSFAVQIAKAEGAEVTGVSTTANLDLMRSLGADHVIDYTRDDFTRSGRRWDVIIDTAGRRSLGSLRRALTPTGTLVIVGGEGGDRWLGGFQRAIFAALLSRFARQRLVMLVSAERREDLARLRELVEAGKVRPLIERTYPLSRAAEAMRDLAERRVRGKVVLTM